VASLSFTKNQQEPGKFASILVVLRLQGGGDFWPGSWTPLGASEDPCPYSWVNQGEFWRGRADRI